MARWSHVGCEMRGFVYFQGELLTLSISVSPREVQQVGQGGLLSASSCVGVKEKAKVVCIYQEFRWPNRATFSFVYPHKAPVSPSHHKS